MKEKNQFKLKRSYAALMDWIHLPLIVVLIFSIWKDISISPGLYSWCLVPVILVFLGCFIKTKNRMTLLLFLGSMMLLLFIHLNHPSFKSLDIGFYNENSELRSVLIDLKLMFAISLLVLYEAWVRKTFPRSNFQLRYFRGFLEAAARPIEGTSNGYTGRPYPVGNVTYTREDITGFARFLQKHLIATSYIDDDGVTLVFSNGLFQYIPFLKPDLTKSTYMTFDYDGNFSLFISKKHYRKYKSELTFDELCNNMGYTFLVLLADFMNGERKEILKKVKRIIPTRFLG